MTRQSVANDLTAKQVRALLNYEPNTGVFTWREPPKQGRASPDGLAGRLNNSGTRQIGIKGREYTARRLAWLCVYGEWPAVKVEPLNQDPDDLRIENLSLVKPICRGAMLTPDRLRELLDYDQETGEFRWRDAAPSARQWGEVAGCATGERILISVDGQRYFAHRLAFLHVEGRWPDGFVDHKHGDPKNNRWGNLRDVTPRVNSENQRGPHRGSSSEFLGVYWREDRQKWQATITVDGTKKHLGLFEIEAEAGAAYLAAKRELHEGCTI